jgi:signal peptidase I
MPRQESKLSAFWLVFLELVKIVLIAGITIVLVRYFLFKPFYVEGASMAPSFEEHEYLIIDELSYRFNEPKRGDPIVFRYPNNPKIFYLKRIIGLPGERLKISDNKVILFNDVNPKGVVLHEEYIDIGNNTDGEQLVVLKDDEYFVMGDNRENSYDSRRFGAISRKAIIGRAWFRGWPFSKFGLIYGEDYGL